MKIYNPRYQFSRNNLPDPFTYYSSQGIVLIGNGDWRSTLCVFHNDTRESLSVNIKIGCFKCFACEAKGGDVLSFHMQRYNLNFANACKELGAWECQ